MEKDINSMNHNFVISILDTDSLTISKEDNSQFSKEEIDKLTKEINDISDELIKWEFEFYAPKIIAVKAKNYIIDYGNGKIKTKGSSIRDKKKEPALVEFMDAIIDDLLKDGSNTVNIYHKYIREVFNITDISRWCQRKSISKSVLNAKGHEMLTKEEKKEAEIRKNETVIWDAVKHRELNQEGDRIHIFPAILGERDEEQEIWRTHPKTKIKEFKGTKTVHIIDKGLLLLDKWDGSNHDVNKLLDRVYATVSVFDTVIDMDKIIDYNKKNNQELLEKFKNDSI